MPQLLALAQTPNGREAGVLVRWQCMVQDTGLGNELCLSSLHVDGKEVSGFYGCDACYDAAAQERAAMDPRRLGERAVLCGVSVPGETTWARSLTAGDAHVLSSALDEMSLSLQKLKRAPLAEQPSITALIKMYGLEQAEQIKTTDVIDVVGLLDTGTLPNADWQWTENDQVEVPILPCIHALYVDRQPAWGLVEKLHAKSALHTSPFSDHAEMRQALLSYLASALGGDRLAAEYVLLALLAKVHIRRAGITAGSLSVNLIGMDEHALDAVLHEIVPAVVTQSLQLEHLNDPQQALFVRSTDHGIQAGRLQLPPGTCVLVDETSMGEGELKDHGVRNIKALVSVLQQRTLPYVFPYSELDMDTDLNMLVLSAGKSFLPVDVHVPVQRTDAIQQPNVAQDRLHAWRTFLARTRHVQLDIPDAVSEHIQNDFVERRKVSRSFSQDDLQRCLSTARLLALSHGHSALTPDVWADAIALDEARATRVPPRATP